MGSQLLKHLATTAALFRNPKRTIPQCWKNLWTNLHIIDCEICCAFGYAMSIKEVFCYIMVYMCHDLQSPLVIIHLSKKFSSHKYISEGKKNVIQVSASVKLLQKQMLAKELLQYQKLWSAHAKQIIIIRKIIVSKTFVSHLASNKV